MGYKLRLKRFAIPEEKELPKSYVRLGNALRIGRKEVARIGFRGWITITSDKDKNFQIRI